MGMRLSSRLKYGEVLTRDGKEKASKEMTSKLLVRRDQGSKVGVFGELQ